MQGAIKLSAFDNQFAVNCLVYSLNSILIISVFPLWLTCCREYITLKRNNPHNLSCLNIQLPILLVYRNTLSVSQSLSSSLLPTFSFLPLQQITDFPSQIVSPTSTFLARSECGGLVAGDRVVPRVRLESAQRHAARECLATRCAPRRTLRCGSASRLHPPRARVCAYGVLYYTVDSLLLVLRNFVLSEPIPFRVVLVYYVHSVQYNIP